MAFCKIVIASVGSIDSCKYIIENKKVKKISFKDRLWAENLKKITIEQKIEQKIAFSKRKYSSMYKPRPNISLPKKNLVKRPFDQK